MRGSRRGRRCGRPRDGRPCRSGREHRCGRLPAGSDEHGSQTPGAATRRRGRGEDRRRGGVAAPPGNPPATTGRTMRRPLPPPWQHGEDRRVAAAATTAARDGSSSTGSVADGERSTRALPPVEVMDNLPGGAQGGRRGGALEARRGEQPVARRTRQGRRRHRRQRKVMDILKLASEMDLSCIKAYKLDALKSVRKTGVADNQSEAIETTTEDPCHSTVDGRSTSVDEDNSITTVVHSDDKNLNAKRYISKAELRKNVRRMKNGPGRNNCSGGRVDKSKGFCPNSFDRVLLDAPCSALGLRPRLFAGEETLESLRNHAKYQRRMFDQAVKLVRPGGVIVYSTCTINPGENEALVRYALDTYKYLSLVSQYPKVGGPGIGGSCELFNKTYTEEWLREDEAELVQRFDPSSSVDTIGFFIAKFNVGERDK